MLVRRVGRPGLLGLAARTAVVAGTASAVNGSMQRRQMARQEQAAEASAYQQEQAAQAYAPPPAPAQAAPATDIVSQLERLAALQQSGVLTPEEFAAQKAKLLGE